MDQDKLTSTASYLWPMHLGGLIDLHFMSTWLAFSNRCCCSRCCWCCFSHVSPWSNRTQQSAATAANRKPHKDKRIEPYKHASFFHVWHSETNMKYIIPNVQHNRSAEMALPVSKKTMQIPASRLQTKWTINQTYVTVFKSLVPKMGLITHFLPWHFFW